MKKLFFILITFLLTLNPIKSQSLVSKISATEIEQLETWHHLLGLDDGSSVFVYTDASRTSFFMKRFDKDAVLTIDKKILEFKAEKGNKIEISEVFEINKSLIFFISFAYKKNIKILKITIDKQTGDKIDEEELVSYLELDHKQVELKNYFFDFTKNDSLSIYYFMAFVRAKGDNNDLKIFAYDYNHKKISSFSKSIIKNYNTVNFISSVQEGKNYYVTINYLQEIKGSNWANKQQVILYKFSNDILEELPLQIEKTERPYSYIAGQFTVNHNKQVRLAISNCYTSNVEKVNVGNPEISDVYVFGLLNNKLEIANKYNVAQSKLHENYKNISTIKSKDKIYLYNYLVNFYTNPNNQDELVFQSYSDNRNGDALSSDLEDIGVFDFSESGNVLNSNHFLLNWDDRLHSFKYNLSDRGKTPNMYNFFSPIYITPHKHIAFIMHNKNTYFFFNDIIENLNVVNRNEMKPLGRLRDATGTVITTNTNGTNKSLIFNTTDQLYFDFSTASFNKKNGQYSVIINRNKKFHVTYLTLN